MGRGGPEEADIAGVADRAVGKINIAITDEILRRAMKIY